MHHRCGQKMQVPLTAIGRTGQCPSCGKHIKISHENTGTNSLRQDAAKSFGSSLKREFGSKNEDAKKRFAEGVDLYYAGRFAEALVIFNSLERYFPGNQDIQRARITCQQALKRGLPDPPRALEHEEHPVDHSVANPMDNATFDEETVKKVILEKMFLGATETIQLQAAELAAVILGMLPESAHTGNQQAESPKEDVTEARSNLRSFP